MHHYHYHPDSSFSLTPNLPCEQQFKQVTEIQGLLWTITTTATLLQATIYIKVINQERAFRFHPSKNFQSGFQTAATITDIKY